MVLHPLSRGDKTPLVTSVQFNCNSYTRCFTETVGEGIADKHGEALQGGPSKVLVGWVTVHLAPPITGLYVH